MATFYRWSIATASFVGTFGRESVLQGDADIERMLHRA